jgi:GT2 family glycosyltransferase
MNKGSEAMNLSIIIVSWNSEEVIEACLSSIISHTRDIEYEIIVIDNDSHDRTKRILFDRFSKQIDAGKVHIIENSSNNGFAKAVNQGIARARGEYLLLLNPDTYIVDNAFVGMLGFMQAHEDVGVLGPALRFPDETVQPSCRRFPTFAAMALILLKAHHFLPATRPLRQYHMADFDHRESRDVDQVMGAAYLIRRTLIDRIGQFDEDFWIWYEEVDFCKRTWQAGWRVHFFADSTVYHHKSKSFDQVASVRKQRLHNRSMIHYFRKHHSFLSVAALLALHPISFVLAWIVGVFALQKTTKNL